VKFPVIDGHADTLDRYLQDPAGFFGAARAGHLDAARMRETGQNVQVMAAYTPPSLAGDAAFEHAMGFVRTWDAILDSRENAAFSPPFLRILTRGDLRAACAPGSRGLLLFLEGASPLRGRLEDLDTFFARGVRGITITHNHDNEAARGCFAEGEDAGLTAFGRSLVRAMDGQRNARSDAPGGMVVDVAHANERTFWDVLEIARGPVIDSHTGLRAFWNHPRNLDDGQLAALARTGGVACIDFVPDHLETRPDPAVPVRIAQAVRVIRAAVERVGIGAVGLGSDWDGFGQTVEGLADCTALPRLADAMAADGFGDGDIARVFGGNLHRALGQILP
jgi:membrane dipeptidase